MKRIIISLTVIVGLMLTSCSTDDNLLNNLDELIDNSNNGNNGGGSNNNTIELSGSVTENTTLNAANTYKLTGAYIVQPGVTLTIPAGTNIEASTGGTDIYIAILKGAKIDIQGTSTNPVIIASANKNAGDWGGLVICGNGVTTAGVDATAEVGGLKYGGTDNADNSGTIKNLVVGGSGAAINPESEFNGITFYAVGSGTTVENIAVYNGNDDGVEFFGGSVSAKNLYFQDMGDDSVDWTEGWSGTLENTYIRHDNDGFSTALEGDGQNNNPVFVNLTCVSSVGGTALQFKKESGASITGLSLTGYSTQIDMKDNGSLSNVKIDGKDATTTDSYYAPATVDISNWTWISSINQNTEYLSGTISGNRTLSPSTSYLLTSSLIVQSGATLNIPAGTKITAAKGGTDVYIAVLKGGEINITGTSDKPVVMSSADATAGDWGGLVICGNGVTTAGVDATAEVGGFKYGGTDNADNSGVITYLVLRGSGAAINPESEYNGITFYAVGSGTTVSNIAVTNGNDDGVEFLGGAVSAENLYFEDNYDDSVDWTEGWSGTLINTYIIHNNDGFSTAIEGDGVNNQPIFTNFTAISTVGGTALQFKKESGATMTDVYLEGYNTNIDMKDNGALSNAQINGADADPSASYNTATKVDISTWTWKDASL